MTQVFTMTFGGKKQRTVKASDGTKSKAPAFVAKTVVIDYDELPETSRAKILEYGLTQYIGDGAAGAGDQVDFNSGIDDKVAKLKSGDFSRESGPIGGNMYDSVEKLVAAKVRAMIAGALKAASMEVTKEVRAAMVASFIATPEKVAPIIAAAEAEIAAHKAALGAVKADAKIETGTSAADALAALGL